MSAQPEALRIADELLALHGPTEIDERAATELRRLHAEVEQLRKSNSVEFDGIKTHHGQLAQAARQALEAMHFYMTAWNGGEVTWFRECYKAEDKVCAAITALREALEAAPEPAAVGQEPVALGPLAKRRVFDYIRGAYDLGYNDARTARAVPGDNAPGYKGRDVEVDHGGALFNALRACITAPQPARQPARQPLDDGKLRAMWVQHAPYIGAPLEFARAIEKAHGIGGEACTQTTAPPARQASRTEIKERT